MARTILAHLNVSLADGDERDVADVRAAIEAAVEVGFDPDHTGGMEPTVTLVEEV